MIEQLLTNFIFDKLNKQIVKKIPTCLFTALLINLIFGFIGSVEIVAIYSFIVFLVLSVYFNYSISKATEDIWNYMDFNKIVGKIASIFESGLSWVKDVQITRPSFILTGFFSGIFLTISITSIFLLLLEKLSLDITLLITFLIITALYIFLDAAKGELIEEPEGQNKSKFLYDFMDTYMVENTVKNLSIDTLVSRVGLSLLVPVISPLTYFKFPKMAFKEMVVLKNDDLMALLTKYTETKDDFYFKHEGGKILKDVFAIENKTENITIFSEESQKKILPYLLDPDYTEVQKKNPTDEKKWAAFSIQKRVKSSRKKDKKKKGTESCFEFKMIGHVFIHGFKGRLLVRENENKPLWKIKRRDVILIMVFGDRSTAEFIENTINRLAVKVPRDRMV